MSLSYLTHREHVPYPAYRTVCGNVQRNYSLHPTLLRNVQTLIGINRNCSHTTIPQVRISVVTVRIIPQVRPSSVEQFPQYEVNFLL